MLSRLMTRREQFLILFLACSMALGAAALYLRGQGNGPATEPAKQETKAPTKDTNEPAESPMPAAVASLPSEAQAAPVVPGAGAETVAPPAPPKELAVSVAGAVRNPGLKRLAEGARVEEALRAAGGPADNADVSDLNLAAPLRDGTTLTVPSRMLAERKGTTLRIRAAQDGLPATLSEYTISGSRIASQSAFQTNTPAEGAAPDAVSRGEKTANKTNGPIDLNTASESDLDTLPGIGPKLAQQIISYRTQAPLQSVDDLLNVPGIGAKKLESIRRFVTVSSSSAR